MEINEGKRRQEQQHSQKSSRSGSPEPTDGLSPSSDESYRPLQRTPPPSRAGPPPSPPVPTKPVAPVAPEPSGPLPLAPCPVCGRTFVPQSLAKHVKICEKMTVKKRKTFDSSRQRREGTDLEQYLPKNFGLPENSPFLEKSPPNTAKATPKPKVQSVRSAIMKPTADLQKCPHCGRAFGVRAFERHVEWCADKAKILPAAPAQPPPHIADAKQRLNARTQYKAPPVRTRRSSQTREKSSNSRSASVESNRGISPPREYGDYKHPRSRASESASSNECHEESSPHVPVIRNSRASQNKSSGDANIKARQARLARDLSSSRNNQEPNIAPIQQSNTDPDVNKHKKENKQKPRMNVKKKQQLKKLEELAEKHKERNQKELVKTQKAFKATEKIECPSKSQIPVTRKQNIMKKTKILKDVSHNEAVETKKECLSKEIMKKAPAISTVTVKEKVTKNKIKKEISKKNKESSMSLDSLEDCPPGSSREQKSQSVGINTELLCPCVPCIIHGTSPPKNKVIKDKFPTTPQKSKVQTVKGKDACENDEISIRKEIIENTSSIELLYKNLSMVSSCDISKELREQDCDDPTAIFSQADVPCYHSYTNGLELTDNIKGLDMANEYSDTNFESKSEMFPNITTGINLSNKMFDENYERELSEDSLECEVKEVDDENRINLVSRHGSGDTYTKFTDNPADLEEFLLLTENMICDKSNNELTEKDVEHLHTPKTSSIESLCVNNKTQEITTKHNFSDTIEDLKNNFKDILQEAPDKDISLNDTEDLNRKVSDLEHITVYELKFYEQKLNTEEIIIKKDTDITLPSIKENNKFTRKGSRTKNKISNIYKENRKCKMQNRAVKDYQTFIIKENREESSDEAPPLKLPRIDLKRLDDDYDPFASAARQMKELMSSDTNIPKKLNSKDSNRTLPTLKPTPTTKPSSLLRPDNTKTMKDSINKTYQKTPTLHRMKSFGSTNSDNNPNAFGGRCSSFRMNRNDKKPGLNTTFTKSSKENISSADRSYVNRNNSFNRSFSYNSSAYSTPKLKEKHPKLSTSMHHAFQRNTAKQPLKLDKIKTENEKKDFVNLDVILSCDNSSMTDSNYIDPMLINENDNLPINVNTILNNPDIISSLESLLTTENLPAKFESFNTTHINNNSNDITKSLNSEYYKNETNNNFHSNNATTPIISDLTSQYTKLMSSLEHSIASRTSGRDDDSLCEDFDLEEFMTSFDDEVNKQKSEKRTCSSTTRVVKQSELSNDVDPKVETQNCFNRNSNGLIPVNKSMSLVFSSNNIVGEKLFPSSVKRSTSLLDSIQKKPSNKMDAANKSRHKTDQLEDDIMQSLKEFDKFYESQKHEKCQSKKDINKLYIDTVKRDSRKKCEQRNNRSDNVTNGNHTPCGKISNDSAYSSLNRVSPSKLSLCNVKESGDVVLLEQIPAGSDTSDSQKEDRRSVSSEEFLAMERSTELQETLTRSDVHSSYNNVANPSVNDKYSRASTHQSTTRRANSKEALSSSGSESSLHRGRKESAPGSAPRLSRFCHECGSKFPVDTAKFCIECGVKRLLV